MSHKQFIVVFPIYLKSICNNSDVEFLQKKWRREFTSIAQQNSNYDDHTRKNRMRFLIIVVSILCYLPLSAFAWWNEEWSNRVAVNLSIPQHTTTEATKIPVLVKLHAGNFPDFFLLNENLSDLRFIDADDKTPLNFHVDSFDLINQQLLIWVDVVSVTAGGSKKIWMYYGNEKAVAGSNAAATFDAKLSSVIHFAKDPDSWADATAYNSSTSLNGGEVIKASLIGSGLKLGGSEYLIIQNSPGNRFDSNTGFGFSFWIKPTGLSANSTLFRRVDDAGNSLTINLDTNGINIVLINAGTTTNIQTEAIILSNQWSHLAFDVKQNAVSIYVNGVSVKTQTISPVILTGILHIGGSTTGEGFNGEMDEVRFYQESMGELIPLIEAKNQGLVDEVVSAGTPEQPGAETANEEAGLFEVTVHSMDEAGWIVTIILLIMSFITWLVMIGKFIYLSQVDKDNKRFNKAFAKSIQEDPASLDREESDEDEKELDASPITQALFGKHDHYQSSPIYRLYHRGISEIRARSKIIQETGLTSRSNAAVRAALDAQTVREAQRLQSQMIFLTIGISGGPFVGLFGTVMGVMMTFAGIAATGDVNISAIAPGVSAALLTTLAGLFVAIPALFGFNYLTSRIKSNIADMRVFSDEFATRLAEYYGKN
jgi:biopolymer transport protein ExbB